MRISVFPVGPPRALRARLARIQVVGTVGIIVRAGRIGTVPREAARTRLDSLLPESILFIMPNLIDRATRALDA